MKRLTATFLLLVALASPLWAQYETQSSGTNTTNTQTDNKATTTDNTMTSDATTTDATTTENLPATASPLPLLLLMGVGALASSLWLRRRRHA
jgi:LPXTG-motif cell wall-anchored protein